jgi:hypothetical protein
MKFVGMAVAVIISTMAPLSDVTGICATCNHKAQCVLRAGFRGPIFYCEEFDDTCGLTIKKRSSAAEESDAGGQRTGLIGLCAYCERGGRCSLSGTPGGVWHCEEYV